MVETNEKGKGKILSTSFQMCLTGLLQGVRGREKRTVWMPCKVEHRASGNLHCNGKLKEAFIKRFTTGGYELMKLDMGY